ncbi:ABC transporter permease [Amycolatopsis sp. 195334CR]|uniref:ABC transporter permease n=1 Tax=Amycolatopsis sp. 195334CR TaxID=2814588 RepID=UPI001A8F9729|nr:ABC transporter permease [Amycolatopsis sp. 195334CR]MBN6041307.1 ABC transporter permease [Amycolatopsis sp. 195334CR]
MTAALAAEWRKLRSVQSTQYVLGMVLLSVVVGAALAWAWGQTWDSMSAERRGSLSDGSIEETLLPVLQLCLGILGALTITAEYATGLIRTSLTVLPRRTSVFAAKAITVGVLALAAGIAATFAIHLLSKAVFGDRTFPGYHDLASEAPGLLGAGTTVGLVALIGFGAGTVLRSTAGAVSVLVVLLFVLPMISGFLPEPWGERIGSALLTNPVSALVLAAVLLAVAAVTITRRDVG